MRPEILTAVNIKMVVWWDVTPCTLRETATGTSEATEMEVAASSLNVRDHLPIPQHHISEGCGLNITLFIHNRSCRFYGTVFVYLVS
jgi:hypothetical protein